MKTVAGRLELKPAINGAFLVDDSYNANPSSLKAGLDAFRSFGGARWLVLGEMRELGDSADELHAEVGRYARQAGIERLLAVGERSRFAVEAFGPGAQWFADHRRADARSAQARSRPASRCSSRARAPIGWSAWPRALARDSRQQRFQRRTLTDNERRTASRMLLYLATKTRACSKSAFRLFSYLTLRAILAALTALVISFLVGPWMIRTLSHNQIGQRVRDDGPKSHLPKAGTPTMGGALILVAIGASTLLWADLTNRFVWVTLLRHAGVRPDRLLGRLSEAGRRQQPRADRALQIFLAVGRGPGLRARAVRHREGAGGDRAVRAVLQDGDGAARLRLHRCSTYFVVVGTSNAVNLTDGLDGLAIMPAVLVGGALGVFAYATGNAVFSGYLGIPFIEGTGEILVFCATLVGAGLGFLWFNTYPAQVFMGDIGALALGAALGVVAVIVRQEIVLFIMGGVFVMETVSVMLQVASYKLTGKRIFRMAPIHHHFELKGWAEPKVIVRFWIISVILVLVGLATLKVR